MAKNVFCDNGCKYEANGFKINNVDLKDILDSGVYLLGDTITDTLGTWNDEMHETTLEESFLIVNNIIDTINNSYSATQVIYSISGNVMCRREIFGDIGGTPTVDSWLSLSFENLVQSTGVPTVSKIEVVESYPENEENDVLYIKIN